LFAICLALPPMYLLVYNMRCLANRVASCLQYALFCQRVSSCLQPVLSCQTCNLMFTTCFVLPTV
jgi:hypothetical protein